MELEEARLNLREKGDARQLPSHGMSRNKRGSKAMVDENTGHRTLATEQG